MHQLTPEQSFDALLAAEPSRPFVTYYDEATGERSELSAKSLANWVAKTHHLLGDELGLGVGDTALVALPAHWISVPILLGCLTAGLALIDDPAQGEAAVAFVTPTSAPLAAGVLDVYAIAPDSAAVGLRDGSADGASDYVSAVRPQADKWPSVVLAAGGPDPCLPPARTRADVSALARRRVGELGLAAGARVLSTRNWTGCDDWVDTLLAPLAVGGSVVYVAHCADEDVLTRRGEQERTSVRI